MPCRSDSADPWPGPPVPAAPSDPDGIVYEIPPALTAWLDEHRGGLGTYLAHHDVRYGTLRLNLVRDGRCVLMVGQPLAGCQPPGLDRLSDGRVGVVLDQDPDLLFAD